MENQPLIGSLELKNLGSPDPVVRVRTLREVIAALKNNIIWIDAGTEDEAAVVNVNILVTHLFKWFCIRPVHCEEEAVGLLHDIFSRRHFVRYVCRQVSINQVVNSMRQIASLVSLPKSRELAQSALIILEGHLRNPEPGMLHSSSSSDPELPHSIPIEPPSDDVNAIENQRRLVMVSPTPSHSERMDARDVVVEHTGFWERLQGVNLEIFAAIDEQFSDLDEPQAMETALTTLRASIGDFPPEFFFQPPHLLESLINVISNDSTKQAIQAIHLIRHITNGLKERWPEFLKSERKVQEVITIGEYLNRILAMLSDFFERILDHCDFDNFERIVPLLNEMYLLFYDTANFIKLTKAACDIKVNELLNMMAKVTKDLRLRYSETQNQLMRLHYMIFLYMINVLAASIDISYIYHRSDTNEWEVECDNGLVDVALAISYPRLHALIKANRRDRIEDNASLQLMMDSRAHWRPVVQVFQGYEKMSDEEIINKGHRAINTVRIHRNFELIQLLVNKIHRSAEAIFNNDALRAKGEEIILRLLSNEVLTIRRYSYSLAYDLVKSKFEEGVDDLTAMSLTTVFGIPVTVEIVTEILIFGLKDEDETIRRHSCYILFALLRSKMVYGSWWIRILTIIRPALPLLMCLVNTSNSKLGIFVYDVYQERNGFSEFEINKGLLRFLYANDSKIRQMAMKRVLDSLQVPGDIIDILPDNFCILGRGLVTELKKPIPKGGFPMDTYQALTKFLHNHDFHDQDLVRMSILQLSCLMGGSLECCLQAHRDNVWVPFMLPDFGFPDNLEIRMYVIEVLYNFTVSVNELRVYYAAKPEIIAFLVNTLIYFQEHEVIKTKASIILFMLLFSECIVNSEYSTSIPTIVSNMCCPFKYQQHWEVSPFNCVGKLEDHREANHEDQEIVERSMRFSFALEWFKGEKSLIEMKECDYFKGFAGKPFLVHNELRLTKEDLLLIRHTHGERILEELSNDMINATDAERAQELVDAAQSFMKMPFIFEESHVEVLRTGIDRLAAFTSNGDSRNSITGLMDLYRQLLPQFPNKKVVEFFNKKFVFGIIHHHTINTQGEHFLENLKTINSIVLECKNRPELMKMLIENYEKQHKTCLPSKIIEKIMYWLFDDESYALRWKQESRRPQLLQMLILMRNVFRIMPINLDAVFLSTLFYRLVLIGLTWNKVNHRERVHQNSSVVKYVFGIADALTLMVKNMQLRAEIYKALAFWSIHRHTKDRSLPMMVIVNLSKSEKDFVEFAKTFHKTTRVSLFSIAKALFDKYQKFVTPVELKAAALLIGNILEFDPRNSVCEYLLDDLINIMAHLLAINNMSALSFIVRKMVTCNTPHYVRTIKNMRIIEKLLEFKNQEEYDESDYQLLADQFETITLCHENFALSDHVNEIVITHSTAYFMLMFKVSCADDLVYKNFTCKAFNQMMIMTRSEVGIARITQALNKRTTVTQFLLASHYNLNTKHHPNELIFQLNFWYVLLNLCDNVENSAIDLICNAEIRQANVEMIVKDIGNHKFFKDLNTISNGADFLVVQLMTIFDYAFSTKMEPDTKYELKALSFLCLKLLFKKSEKARKFFDDNDMVPYVANLIDLAIGVMKNHRYLETTRKCGVQKCGYMIKDLVLLLKSFIEWRLPLMMHQKLVADLSFKLSKINDWLEADVVLMNNYLNLLRVVMSMEIGKETVAKDSDTFPLVKSVLKKVQQLTQKPPHTETNLALISNGLHWLMACGQFVEARTVFKNMNAFSIFDNLHPQIHPNRKSTWDNVTLEWLQFFEFLSRFEDTDCKSHHVNQLCRLIRLGNRRIRASTLRVIRNASKHSSIGVVLLNSDDFKNTVDSILSDTAISEEKSLILQTLLVVGGKSDQCKAKLKNSSLNRKLRDQLETMQENMRLDPRLPRSAEFVVVLNLADMLRQLLDIN